VWRAAARRFLQLLGGSLAVVAAASLLLGLLLGSSVQRALSLGFYLVGSFLLVAGFFLGNRGPARLKGPPGDEGPWGVGSKRKIRWATAEEREEALASSAVFVTLGLALIAMGVVFDNRYELV
jgi:hypothetical protein